MVRANLHVICGNCGSNEFLTHKIEPEGVDHGDHFESCVYISCGNCATLHNLSDTVEVQVTEDGNLESQIKAYCKKYNFTNSFNQVIEEYKSKIDGCNISNSGECIISNFRDELKEYLSELLKESPNE